MHMTLQSVSLVLQISQLSGEPFIMDKSPSVLFVYCTSMDSRSFIFACGFEVSLKEFVFEVSIERV